VQLADETVEFKSQLTAAIAKAENWEAADKVHFEQVEKAKTIIKEQADHLDYCCVQCNLDDSGCLLQQINEALADSEEGK